MTISVSYDIIIVGARVAGSTLAALLARKGYRILVVDRARFPSDTISTHMIWPPGVAALRRFGFWPRIEAAGAARCHVSATHGVGGTIRGPWHIVEGADYSANLRRFKFDAILVDEARRAGAEVLESVAVTGLVWNRDQVVGVKAEHTKTRRPFAERARLVVGADGLRSSVAKWVEAPSYKCFPSMTASYYGYFTDVIADRDVNEMHRWPPYEYLFVPTDDGLVLVNLVLHRSRLPEFRSNVRRNFFAAFEAVDDLWERLQPGRLIGKIRGAIHLPNYYRRPFGPGWVLAGDAGYHRDPIRAQGMHDALLDAESLAGALDDGLSGRRALEDALRVHEEARNLRTRIPYRNSVDAAKMELPTPSMLRLMNAVRDNPLAIQAMRGLMAGSLMPEQLAEQPWYKAFVENERELATTRDRW
ncbi:NAD(P)/FAD-dependent oxidoreductase [Sorangium sp. So ce1128]